MGRDFQAEVLSPCSESHAAFQQVKEVSGKVSKRESHEDQKDEGWWTEWELPGI